MLANVKNAAAAYLALSLAAQPSMASPLNAEHQEHRLGQKATDYIQYGRCYTIKNGDGEELGHLKSTPSWNYLGFGSNAKTAHFKVCQSLGHCYDPNRSQSTQVLWNQARFWLFDVEGNAYSPKGEFIAANSPPFGSNRNLYPGGAGYKYFVNFWGENDGDYPDSHALGPDKVKLRVDNLRDDKGLVITNKNLKCTPKDDFVMVSFHEVKCSSASVLEEQNPEL
ncbi:hypothetical protein F53441_9643 [Fusarium austroafricanum]|uniref:Uncharacterized protein n=1 Tax=Fusarium austroafricanum TaxID=2364996 RepID=A0A8H4K8P5_9HYPO|nr:hypothetical protein F53441_9643 [Fusarium austroafricanum]